MRPPLESDPPLTPSQDFPPAPAAEATLAVLRDFRSVLWLDNPCSRGEGHCIYMAEDAPGVLAIDTAEVLAEYLEREYVIETRALPSYITHDEFARISLETELLPSDSYVCHGSTSQGSGRSVTKGLHQLKGVGRTLHAAYHGAYRDVNGAVPLSHGVLEAFHEKRLRHVLTTPPLPIDFILVPSAQEASTTRGDSHVRCIVGRRGSPLRLGHLEYLLGALRTTRESSIGSYLVHLLLAHDGGVPQRDVGAALLAAFDLMMRRAIRFSAESLVYSLRFSYWPDNFDLFSRAMDVGETQYLFPAPLRDATTCKPPATGDSPRAYFRDFDPGETHSRSATLYPIRNVLSALFLVAREAGLDLTTLEERYSWPWIEAEHGSSICYAIARVLGVDRAAVDAPHVRRELDRLTVSFPLVGNGQELGDAWWSNLLTAIASGGAAWSSIGASMDHASGATFRALIGRAECAEAMADVRAWSGAWGRGGAASADGVLRAYRSVPHLSW